MRNKLSLFLITISLFFITSCDNDGKSFKTAAKIAEVKQTKYSSKIFSYLNLEEVREKTTFDVYSPYLAPQKKVKSNIVRDLVYDFIGWDNSKLENVLLIGNGGAGAVGLIEKLARVYNFQARREQDKLLVIWTFNHSFENFSRVNNLDAAITYEPHREKELADQGKIFHLETLFLNHFEIVAPKNAPRLNCERRGYCSPVSLIKELMSQTVQYGTQNYVSRYNHSAMGEKDNLIFRLALAEKYNREDTFAANETYNFWINKIKKETTKLPPLILDEAADNSHYHLNDRAFIYLKEAKERVVTKTSDNLNDPLLNPAQIWLTSKIDLGKNSPVAKFYKWLFSRRGQNVIKEFQIKGQRVYSPKKEITFSAVHRAYTDHIKKVKYQVQIDYVWDYIVL